MKKCNNCGQLMSEDAKFCTNCGTAFAEKALNRSLDTNEEARSEPNDTQTSQVVQDVSNAIKSVEYNKIAQSYWNYLVSTIKKPSSSFKVTDKANGWIQFFMLAILNSLSSIAIISGIPGPGSETGISIFFKLFFVQLIINISSITILFVFKNLVQKVNAPFSVVASQYGGLLSFNIILLLVLLISALISPIAMISIILIASILIGIVNVIGFNMYLLSGKNNARLDNFYVTLLANTVVIIIIAIIVRIGLEMMIDMLPYMFNQYMYY